MPIAETAALMVGNLGVTVTQLVLLLTALGSIIFMAVELRLGFMMMFMLFGVEFVILWSYGAQVGDLTLAGICLLASFVTMTLSLLLIRPKQNVYGGII